LVSFFFFFNDTATTEIYTLSLHDALPIWCREARPRSRACRNRSGCAPWSVDRKSTRLNSSHPSISYAVFCLKKKTKKQRNTAPATLSAGARVAEKTRVRCPPVPRSRVWRYTCCVWSFFFFFFFFFLKKRGPPGIPPFPPPGLFLT